MKKVSPTNWPTTAPPHPSTLERASFAAWAQWAADEQERALNRARQCRRYRRWLHEEYQARFGEPIPDDEEATP